MLNPQSPLPLYRQLADQLTDQIRKGRYQAGGRIPSEHQLAAAHGIGRPTIRQAIDVLVRKGLLIRRRGSGTYVCEPTQEVDLFSLDGTTAAFQKKGFSVTTHILEPMGLQKVVGQEDNPFAGKHAYCFSRLSSVDGKPVLVEDLYLHAELFAGIDQYDLQKASLSTLADEQYYLRPIDGKQRFRVGDVPNAKAHYLQVAPHTPLLEVKRYLHFPQTPNGVFSELWCRTDRFVFSQHIGGTRYA